MATIYLPLPYSLEVLPLEYQGWRIFESGPLLRVTAKPLRECKNHEAEGEEEETEDGAAPFPAEAGHAGVVHLTDIWDVDSETSRAEAWYREGERDPPANEVGMAQVFFLDGGGREAGQRGGYGEPAAGELVAVAGPRKSHLASARWRT